MRIKKKVNRRTALKIALEVKARLRPYGRVKITGSLRRGKRRVGDIDIQGSSPKMMAEFLKIGQRIVGKPDGVKASILVRGVQVDLWIIPLSQWASGLLTTTGPKEENIWMRGIAKRNYYILNQYGLWYRGKNILYKNTEREIYERLGLEYRKPSERRGWLPPA